MIPPTGPRTRSQGLLEEPEMDSRRVSFGRGRGTLSSSTIENPGTSVGQGPLGERTQIPRSGVMPVPPGETTQLHPGRNQQGYAALTQIPRSSIIPVPQGESTQLNTGLSQLRSTGNTRQVQDSQRISIGTNPGTSGMSSALVNSRTSRYSNLFTRIANTPTPAGFSDSSLHFGEVADRMNDIIEDMDHNISWLQHKLRGDPEASERPPAELIGVEEALRTIEDRQRQLRDNLRREQNQRERLERIQQQQEQEIRQLRERELLARQVYTGTAYTGINSSSPILQDGYNQNTRPVDTTSRPPTNTFTVRGVDLQDNDQQQSYRGFIPSNTYINIPQDNYPGNLQDTHQLRVPGGVNTGLNTINRSSQVAYNRWREIKDSILMSGICFPRPGVTANDFVNSLEARFRREEWNDKELLKVVTLTLKETPASWVDANYSRWENFAQFKREFLKTFGSATTDHQMIIDISQMKMMPEDSPTEFVVKVQQKYRAMEIPPPIHEQVNCIRNNLTDELRIMVFSRQVSTYEDLLNVLHEAARCTKSTSSKTQTVNQPKNSDKPRFGAIQQPAEEMEILEEYVELPEFNAMQLNSGEYDNRYGVYRRTSNQFPSTRQFVRRSFYPRQQQPVAQPAGQQPPVQNNLPRTSNTLPPGQLTAPQQQQQTLVQPLNVPVQNMGQFYDFNYLRGPKPCHNCGVVGHTFDVCPGPRREVCNVCYKIGHSRENCPLFVPINNQNKSGPIITEILEEDAGQQIQKNA